MITPSPYYFPNPESADKQGLLAIGGDLVPERILQAYSQGIFPWYQSGCPVLWWCPNPRLILLPHELQESRSFKKALKRPFRWAIDTAFREVITSCATFPNRIDNTWINQDMIEAYVQLHQQGYAHSFEVWDGDNLIGGLYGISLGNAFFGESMFHTVKDASKIALYYLCITMQDWGFDFIDCQLPNAHLQALGAKLVSRKDFLNRLRLSLEHPTKQGLWA